MNHLKRYITDLISLLPKTNMSTIFSSTKNIIVAIIVLTFIIVAASQYAPAPSIALRDSLLEKANAIFEEAHALHCRIIAQRLDACYGGDTQSCTESYQERDSYTERYGKPWEVGCEGAATPAVIVGPDSEDLPADDPLFFGDGGSNLR